MYCSASHRIDSESSASVITGRLIFLTMTALPESEAATSFVLNALFSNRRLIASATAAASIIAPSTMLSGGTGSIANAMTLYPLPAALSSTALTALEPMSRPTTDFDLPRPNTIVSWLKRVRSSAKRIPNLVRTRACQKPAAIAEICDRSRAFGRAPAPGQAQGSVHPVRRHRGPCRRRQRREGEAHGPQGRSEDLPSAQRV